MQICFLIPLKWYLVLFAFQTITTDQVSCFTIAKEFDHPEMQNTITDSQSNTTQSNSSLSTSTAHLKHPTESSREITTKSVTHVPTQSSKVYTKSVEKDDNFSPETTALKKIIVPYKQVLGIHTTEFFTLSETTKSPVTFISTQDLRNQEIANTMSKNKNFVIEDYNYDSNMFIDFISPYLITTSKPIISPELISNNKLSSNSLTSTTKLTESTTTTTEKGVDFRTLKIETTEITTQLTTRQPKLTINTDITIQSTTKQPELKLTTERTTKSTKKQLESASTTKLTIPPTMEEEVDFIMLEEETNPQSNVETTLPTTKIEQKTKPNNSTTTTKQHMNKLTTESSIYLTTTWSVENISTFTTTAVENITTSSGKFTGGTTIKPVTQLTTQSTPVVSKSTTIQGENSLKTLPPTIPNKSTIKITTASKFSRVIIDYDYENDDRFQTSKNTNTPLPVTIPFTPNEFPSTETVNTRTQEGRSTRPIFMSTTPTLIESVQTLTEISSVKPVETSTLNTIVNFSTKSTTKEPETTKTTTQSTSRAPESTLSTEIKTQSTTKPLETTLTTKLTEYATTEEEEDVDFRMMEEKTDPPSTKRPRVIIDYDYENDDRFQTSKNTNTPLPVTIPFTPSEFPSTETVNTRTIQSTTRVPESTLSTEIKTQSTTKPLETTLNTKLTEYATTEEDVDFRMMEEKTDPPLTTRVPESTLSTEIKTQSNTKPLETTLNTKLTEYATTEEEDVDFRMMEEKTDPPSTTRRTELTLPTVRSSLSTTRQSESTLTDKLTEYATTEEEDVDFRMMEEKTDPPSTTRRTEFTLPTVRSTLSTTRQSKSTLTDKLTEYATTEEEDVDFRMMEEKTDPPSTTRRTELTLPTVRSTLSTTRQSESTLTDKLTEYATTEEEDVDFRMMEEKTDPPSTTRRTELTLPTVRSTLSTTRQSESTFTPKKITQSTTKPPDSTLTTEITTESTTKQPESTFTPKKITQSTTKPPDSTLTTEITTESTTKQPESTFTPKKITQSTTKPPDSTLTTEITTESTTKQPESTFTPKKITQSTTKPPDSTLTTEITTQSTTKQPESTFTPKKITQSTTKPPDSTLTTEITTQSTTKQPESTFTPKKITQSTTKQPESSTQTITIRIEQNPITIKPVTQTPIPSIIPQKTPEQVLSLAFDALNIITQNLENKINSDTETKTKIHLAVLSFPSLLVAIEQNIFSVELNKLQMIKNILKRSDLECISDSLNTIDIARRQGTSELYTCSSNMNTKVINFNDLLFVASQTVRQAIRNSRTDIYNCRNLFEIGKNTSLFFSCIESRKNDAFKAVKVYENKMLDLTAQNLLVDLASCADQILKTVNNQINLNYAFVQMCLSKSNSTISKQLSLEIDSYKLPVKPGSYLKKQVIDSLQNLKVNPTLTLKIATNVKAKVKESYKAKYTNYEAVLSTIESNIFRVAFKVLLEQQNNIKVKPCVNNGESSLLFNTNTRASELLICIYSIRPTPVVLEVDNLENSVVQRQSKESFNTVVECTKNMKTIFQNNGITKCVEESEARYQDFLASVDKQLDEISRKSDETLALINNCKLISETKLREVIDVDRNAYENCVLKTSQK